MSKVAIVIPLYNQEEKVIRTMASIMAQTFTDFECVIVDDGSTDGSADIVQSYIADDPRFKYAWKENGGVATARNVGVFLHTTSPYVLCVDSDDQIEPGYIASLLPYLIEDRSLGIVYTKLIQITDDGGYTESAWPHDFDARLMFESHNLVPTAALSTRKMWVALGGQRKRFHGPGGAGAEDGDFWLRACSLL